MLAHLMLSVKSLILELVVESENSYGLLSTDYSRIQYPKQLEDLQTIMFKK
jgi:hypothetical protein